MKITGVETFRIGLPVRRAHTWAGNYAPIGRDYLFVKIHVDGVWGVGEAQTLPDWGGEYGSKYGEAPKTSQLLIDEYLKPLLIGEDPRRIDHLHAKMDRFVKGYPYAKAAIDVALLDVLGKIANLPVYQLLGGLVREEIEIAHSIGLMEIDVAVSEAEAVFAEGVRCLKLKVGQDIERDVELVRRVRKALPAVRIRVDANQGYRSWKEALRATERMKEFDILFMEQPVEGMENCARVAQATDVPIMLDEGAWNAHDVLRMIRMEAGEMVSLYYTKAGGLSKAKKLIAVAEAGGLRTDVNGSAEMGVGNAANLHLAASSRIVDIPGTIPITSTAEIERTKIAGHKYLDDVITEPFAYKDGTLRVPDGPGLGITLDEKKIAKYRVG
ncbi:MAG: mandelate racemase [Alphaproteobacteria bacterium]|nr:mandelate racemase [Alphaproteobacteria bacterium]